MDGWSINIPGLQFSSIQFFDNQGQTTELLFSLIRKTRMTKKIDVRQYCRLQQIFCQRLLDSIISIFETFDSSNDTHCIMQLMFILCPINVTYYSLVGMSYFFLRKSRYLYHMYFHNINFASLSYYNKVMQFSSCFN